MHPQRLEFRSLKADEVEVRVGTCNEKGLTLLLYKDARVDMALLDETVGAGRWQCSYSVVGENLFCRVGVLTDYEHGPEWVWKEDVGVPSNMEATKGEASDAFKRACFKWGIGRELYTAPFIWVPASSCKIQKNQRGKWQCYDKFKVSSMDVEDGRITSLEVVNTSNKGQVCYRMGGSARNGGAGNEAAQELEAAREELRSALKDFCSRNGGSPEALWAIEVTKAKSSGRADDPSFWSERAAQFREIP